MGNMIHYAWRPGRTFGVPAQSVGEELERIEARDGNVIPSAVVEAAQPEGSILHNFFEWNDGKAAAEYRLAQARTLICCVVVKSIDGIEPKQPVRAFVNLSAEVGREYLGITRVMSDDEKRKRLLAQAKTELEQWRSRYRSLVEFGGVFAAIDTLVAAE